MILIGGGFIRARLHTAKAMVAAFLVVFAIIHLAGTKTVDFPDRRELPWDYSRSA